MKQITEEAPNHEYTVKEINVLYVGLSLMRVSGTVWEPKQNF